jgi:hypothetical protein
MIWRALRIFAAFLFLVGVGMTLYPLIWWWGNPQFTQMEMWREWWMLYVFGVITAGSSAYALKQG